MFRSAVARLPRIDATASSRHDPIEGILPQGFDVRARLQVFPDEGRVVIDLSDNDDCMDNGLNVSRTCALNSAVTGLLNALPEDLPRNAGMLSCIEIVTREGSAVGGPVFPHSCSVATTNLSDRLVNLVQSMLAECGGKVGVAQGGVGMGIASSVISGIDPRNDEPYVNQLFVATASGPASALADGWLTYTLPVASGVCYRDSVEVDERKHPILVESVRIRPGTGGAGHFRGAPAAEVVMGPHGGTVEVVACTDGHVYPARGARGGRDGETGSITLIDEEGGEKPLGNAIKISLAPGQKIRGVETSGAGFGNARTRDPMLVIEDLRNGIETLERARDVFAVVVIVDEADGYTLDKTGTEALRSEAHS